MNDVLKIDAGTTRVKVTFGDREFSIRNSIIETSIPKGMRKDLIEYQEKTYLLGDVNSDSIVFRDFETFLKFQPLLIFGALRKLNLLDKCDEINLKISLSGLYHSKVDDVLKSLQEMFVNGKELKFRSEEIVFQGFGAYSSLIQNKTLKTDEEVLIVDIGGHSIDHIKILNGSPVAFQSFTGGSYYLAQKVKKELDSKFGINISEQQADNTLSSKEVKIYGEAIDVADIVNPLILEWAKEQKQKLKEQYGIENLRGVRVTFVGGASRFLKNLNLFPASVIIDEDEFLQVRGQ